MATQVIPATPTQKRRMRIDHIDLHSLMDCTQDWCDYEFFIDQLDQLDLLANPVCIVSFFFFFFSISIMSFHQVFGVSFFFICI